MILIKKFGGTSVGTTERIMNIAEKILYSYTHHTKKIIIIVSAMAGETDNLFNKSAAFNNKNKKIQDLLVSTGEQVSASLLGMAIENLGINVSIFTGWQIPILTTNEYSSAKIINIETNKINEALKKGNIVIITGFQGVSAENYITTLGRGGSDTSALCVAAALDEKLCYIYTDVDGIYSADPRIVKNAKRLNLISYEVMLELAARGAKVMHYRSIIIAMKYNIEILIMSSFDKENSSFTRITNKENIEESPINCITSKKDLALIAIYEVESINNLLPKIEGHEAIAITALHDNSFNVSFICDYENRDSIYAKVKNAKYLANYSNILVKNNMASITIVGIGIGYHSKIGANIIRIFSEKHIPISMMVNSELKIEIIIDEEYEELGVRLLYDELFEKTI